MTTQTAGSAQGSFVRESGGGQMLVGDVQIAFVVINEARHRAFERVFGCTREQTNLATLIALSLLAHGIHERWTRLMSGPMAPALPDQVLGGAVVRELFSSAAGPAVRESPQLVNLLLLAILARGGLPIVVRGLRGLRGAASKGDQGFRHRYGYLVDVGHRRARHYQAKAQAALAATGGASPEPGDEMTPTQ